jgi:hypothetical protein
VGAGEHLLMALCRALAASREGVSVAVVVRYQGRQRRDSVVLDPLERPP